jgi:hypothetical protein
LRHEGDFSRRGENKPGRPIGPARGGTAQPKRSKQMTTQMKVPDYFGGCPQCGCNDGYVNAGKAHVFICREHKTSWTIGSGLFSSWRDQTEEEQRRIWDEIGLEDFTWVQPLACNDPEVLRSLVGSVRLADPRP